MDIEEQLRRVGGRHAKVAAQLATIEQRRAELIRAGATAGLTRRRIAELVGVSYQRVDQIVRGTR